MKYYTCAIVSMDDVCDYEFINKFSEMFTVDFSCDDEPEAKVSDYSYKKNGLYYSYINFSDHHYLNNSDDFDINRISDLVQNYCKENDKLVLFCFVIEGTNDFPEWKSVEFSGDSDLSIVGIKKI